MMQVPNNYLKESVNTVKRTAGILLSISSLPSKYGIGCFSKSAYEFADWLKEAGQSYWQILPLGPTSPWSSLKPVFHRHKERIVRKPPFIFCKELLIIRVFADVAAFIGLSQNGISVLIQFFVVDCPLFRLCFQLFTFLLL